MIFRSKNKISKFGSKKQYILGKLLQFKKKKENNSKKFARSKNN